MGFLAGLFKKGPGGRSSAIDALRDKADANPKDARLAQDLAAQLKTAGDVVGAIEYSRRAAKAHREAGFNPKALAVLKGAAAWGSPTIDLMEDLSNLLLELKYKEDGRSALKTLRQLYVNAGDKPAVARVDAKLAELGPGR